MRPTLKVAGGWQRFRVSEFPILAGRVAELADLYPDAAFELGLGALVAGLADPPVVKRSRGRS